MLPFVGSPGVDVQVRRRRLDLSERSSYETAPIHGNRSGLSWLPLRRSASKLLRGSRTMQRDIIERPSKPRSTVVLRIQLLSESPGKIHLPVVGKYFSMYGSKLRHELIWTGAFRLLREVLLRGTFECGGFEGKATAS